MWRTICNTRLISTNSIYRYVARKQAKHTAPDLRFENFAVLTGIYLHQTKHTSLFYCRVHSLLRHPHIHCFELQVGNRVVEVKQHYAAKINDEVVKKGTVIGHGDKHSRISSVLHIRDINGEYSIIVELSDFKNRSYGEHAMLGPVYDRLSQEKYYWKPDCSICVYQETSQQGKHILIELRRKKCR